MSNVIVFVNRRKALDEMREQACVWLVKLDAGATEEEMREIRAWLDRDPEHARILVEVASMWDQVSVLSELSEIFPLAQYVQPRSGDGRRGLFAVAVAMAAALMTVAILSGLAWIEHRALLPADNVREVVTRSYETMVGQQSTIILPDDSEIILNTNTLLEVAYSDTERKVILVRGEGHFTVSKDPARPFRVHAGDRVVEALGTAFVVQRIQGEEQEDIEVTVTEGKVNFSRAVLAQADAAAATPRESAAGRAQPAPREDTISVSAGEFARAKREGETVEKMTMAPAEIEEKLAWRHGMLQFTGSSLEEVLREVSRYTPIRIEMDENVRDLDIKVIGYFRAGDVDALLLTMRDTFKLDVERIGEDHIVLSSR